MFRLNKGDRPMTKIRYVHTANQRFTKRELQDGIMQIVTSKTVVKDGIDSLKDSTKKRLNLYVSLLAKFSS